MNNPSSSEREVIRRFESAKKPEELAGFLLGVSGDDSQALRVYLGPDRFRRLYLLAQSLGPRRALRGSLGNVVVIPGIMGSELTVSDMSQHQTLVWASVFRILTGWLPQLRLGADGLNPFDANYTALATGVLNKYYGELVLHLSQRWKARAFWYDWRKSLDVAANDLEHFLRSEFQNEPVSIVAHSMGGLVARTLLLHDPKTVGNNEPLVNRVVMLGTPNFGSFEVPQIFAGIQDTVRQLVKATGGVSGLFNPGPVKKRLLEVLCSFPGIYQMMPWPDKVLAGNTAAVNLLYQTGTYAAFNSDVSAKHLGDSQELQNRLKNGAVNDGRFTYVAGYGELTAVGLNNADDLTKPASYVVSKAGDGRVPHALGILSPERTFYVRGAHGDLARLPAVLGAIDDLVKDGTTTALPKELPAARALEPEDPAKLHAEWARRFGDEQQEQENLEWGEMFNRLDRRFPDSRGSATISPAPTVLSKDEAELEARTLAPFLGQEVSGPDEQAGPLVKATITLALVHEDIVNCHQKLRSGPAVDAIAGGVYAGVQPLGGVLALDRSLSEALPMRNAEGGSFTAKLLLSEMIERGTIRGDLGVPIIVPDPRRDGAGRVVALAGLGTPGRCGEPELALTIRELCWTLNALGKKHLATLLIASGTGNLDVETAVLGLLQGVARALGAMQTDHSPGVPRTLERITIVEYGAYRLEAIDEAIEKLAKQISNELPVELKYERAPNQREKFRRAALAEKKEQLQKQLASLDNLRDGLAPTLQETRKAAHTSTRIAFSMQDGAFQFSAVADEASIPERLVEVDTSLVLQTNDKLVEAQTSKDQLESGLVLGNLIIPRDLRDAFRSESPLILQVDAHSARIHWEMVAQQLPLQNSSDKPSPDMFLGLKRGLTRQLRTAFAPPPEAPPAARRTLRVLIVANPAPDASLPGALLEAAEVADLFDAFNGVYQGGIRTHVQRLFGPLEGDRYHVMSRLFLESFDVLHFAGHCYFDASDPARSGWIFRANPRQVLSAHELRLIDRVPRFVFSNACESGITPDRPERRDANMAPSFAEAFFERGVANLVCTAWPVDDDAARLFARVLYAAMLGLDIETGPALKVRGPRSPLAMHQAMQDARNAVFLARGGQQTWGAYQHYGNPHARFFAGGIEKHARAHYQTIPEQSPPIAAQVAAPPHNGAAGADGRPVGGEARRGSRRRQQNSGGRPLPAVDGDA